MRVDFTALVAACRSPARRRAVGAEAAVVRQQHESRGRWSVPSRRARYPPGDAFFAGPADVGGVRRALGGGPWQSGLLDRAGGPATRRRLEQLGTVQQATDRRAGKGQPAPLAGRSATAGATASSLRLAASTWPCKPGASHLQDAKLWRQQTRQLRATMAVPSGW
jgi:hypothetical protein